jgi:hypothetical protein
VQNTYNCITHLELVDKVLEKEKMHMKGTRNNEILK